MSKNIYEDDHKAYIRMAPPDKPASVCRRDRLNRVCHIFYIHNKHVKQDCFPLLITNMNTMRDTKCTLHTYISHRSGDKCKYESRILCNMAYARDHQGVCSYMRRRSAHAPNWETASRHMSCDAPVH